MAAENNGSPFGEVTAGLYASNAFRISGLPVNATSRDIRRRSEQLRVTAQLGGDTATGTVAGQGVLPLAERPGATAIADALERLRDPARRLVDEFFWFWPGQDDKHDEAMEALRRDDLDAAMAIWASLSGGPTPEAAVAAHNIAVLAHVRALDKPLLSDSVTILWQAALTLWAAVSASDAFWDRVTSRIQEMSDPRLTPATAVQMRQALPSAVLSINAQLALQASREGRLAETTGHVSLMRDSAFGAEAANRVLREQAEPILAQLRSMSQDAERSADSDPRRGAEAARLLLDQASPLLRDARLLLAADHPLVQGIKDEIASTAMRCTVRYVNETGDLQAGRQVLDLALPIAATEAVRKPIRENQATVKEQEEQRRLVLLYSTCWFDKSNPATVADVYGQKMFGNVVRTRVTSRATRVTWKAQTVAVPRCAACAKKHATRRRWTAAAGWLALPVAIGLALGSFAANITALGVILITYDLTAGIPLALALSRGSGIPAAERQVLRDFGPVKELLAKGWNFGAKPRTR
jgi:hypothetical protein